MIEALDHLNIRTARLDAMAAWYCDILGFEVGDRPSFPFPGMWLYANGRPLVHLVGTDTPPSEPGEDAKLEHGAFRDSGLKGFLERLEARGEEHKLSPVEAVGLLQVHVWDPDGNHIHVDFPDEERVEA